MIDENKKYKLKREYPGHSIGDIAIYDPYIDMDNFVWEKPNLGNKPALKEIYVGIYHEYIPGIFQPDTHPDWFDKVEPVVKKNYEISTSKFGAILSATNSKGYTFTVGMKVKLYDVITKIIKFNTFNVDGSFAHQDLLAITELGQLDINSRNLREYRFTTEDGVDVYREESYWFVVHTFDNDWVIMKDIARCPDSGKHPEKYTYFHDNEQAKRFIEGLREKRDEASYMDKKIYSLHDFADFVAGRRGDRTFDDSPMFKGICAEAYIHSIK